MSAMQVAAKISSSLGREVRHIKLTGEERSQQLISFGVPEQFAKFLTWIEVITAEGGEESLGDAVEQVTLRPPKTFDAFVEQTKAAWQ